MKFQYQQQHVRHVSELKKNIIYVGVLDTGWCKIVTRYGEMKVVRGSLVVTKGISQGQFYTLLGTTVTECADVEGIDSGGDPCKCTRL